MMRLDRLPPRDSLASRRLEARGGGLIIAFGGLISISMAGLDPRPIVNVIAGTLGVLLAAAALFSPLNGVPHSIYIMISATVTVLISSVPASIHRPGDLGTGPIFYICVVLHAAMFMKRRESAWLTGWNCLVYLVLVVVELPLASAMAAWLTASTALVAMQVTMATMRERIDDLIGRLQVQAEHDSLTGLFNRQALVDRIHAVPEDHGAALLVVDVDFFKRINDRYGHAAGDTTLAWLGALLRDESAGSGAEPGDPHGLLAPVPARFGGEEFVVWLAGASQRDAAEWAERLRLRVEREGQSRPWPVTISVGVAAGRAGDLVELLNRADHALYRAKHSGRNAVQVAAAA